MGGSRQAKGGAYHQMPVRLPPDLHQWLTQQSERESLSASALIVRALREMQERTVPKTDSLGMDLRVRQSIVYDMVEHGSTTMDLHGSVEAWRQWWHTHAERDGLRAHWGAPLGNTIVSEIGTPPAAWLDDALDEALDIISRGERAARYNY